MIYIVNGIELRDDQWEALHALADVILDDNVRDEILVTCRNQLDPGDYNDIEQAIRGLVPHGYAASSFMLRRWQGILSEHPSYLGLAALAACATGKINVLAFALLKQVARQFYDKREADGQPRLEQRVVSVWIGQSGQLIINTHAELRPSAD